MCLSCCSVVGYSVLPFYSSLLKERLDSGDRSARINPPKKKKKVEEKNRFHCLLVLGNIIILRRHLKSYLSDRTNPPQFPGLLTLHNDFLHY